MTEALVFYLVCSSFQNTFRAVATVRTLFDLVQFNCGWQWWPTVVAVVYTDVLHGLPSQVSVCWISGILRDSVTQPTHESVSFLWGISAQRPEYKLQKSIRPNLFYWLGREIKLERMCSSLGWLRQKCKYIKKWRKHVEKLDEVL